MSLLKYQVHDETSQVSHNCLVLKFFRMDMELSCSTIQVLEHCFLFLISLVYALFHFY